MLNIVCSRQLKIAISSFLISFIHLINGSSMIFSSNIFAQLQEPTSPIKINDEDASWIASISLLVSPIGFLIAGILTDKIGRKATVQIAYIPNILGWLIIANANSLTTIIIGRAILGTAFGSVSCVFVYLAEVCPTEVRPLYFSLINVMVGTGMLVESTFSIFLDWHTVSAVLFAMSIVGGVLLFAVPESPAWLRSRGRTADAERAEKWFGTVSAGETPPPAVVAAVPETRPLFTVYASAAVWKPAILCAGLYLLQQTTGFPILLFYSVDVLRGFRVPWNGAAINVLLAACRVLGGLAFSALYNVNCRTLMVLSSAGMAASVAAVLVYPKAFPDNGVGSIVVVVAFSAYVFFAMIAVLPLPWTLPSEVFPMAVKGTMCGILNIFGFESMFLNSKLYPQIASKFGIETVWTVFAVFCVVNAFYGKFIMPETKGKSLEEILSEFDSSKKTIENNVF